VNRHVHRDSRRKNTSWELSANRKIKPTSLDLARSIARNAVPHTPSQLDQESESLRRRRRTICSRTVTVSHRQPAAYVALSRRMHRTSTRSPDGVSEGDASPRDAVKYATDEYFGISQPPAPHSYQNWLVKNLRSIRCGSIARSSPPPDLCHWGC